MQSASRKYILLRCSFHLKWIKLLFSLINLHKILHNDKAKTHFCKFKINKKQKPYLRKCSEPLQWDSKLSSGASFFHWSSLRCFYNLIGAHDLERHTPVYIRSHSWQCMSEQKPSHEVQAIVGRAPRLCRGTDLEKDTKTFQQHWISPKTEWPPSFLNGISVHNLNNLNLIDHLWRDTKIAVQRRSPPTWKSLRGSAEKNRRNLPKVRS